MLEHIWSPVWKEVWPQMLLLQTVIKRVYADYEYEHEHMEHVHVEHEKDHVEYELSGFHALPREVVSIIWMSLVDVFFHQREKIGWEKLKMLRISPETVPLLL